MRVDHPRVSVCLHHCTEAPTLANIWSNLAAALEVDRLWILADPNAPADMLWAYRGAEVFEAEDPREVLRVEQAGGATPVWMCSPSFAHARPGDVLSLNAFRHPERAVYMFGSNGRGFAGYNFTVHNSTQVTIPGGELWDVSAAAIVLAHRRAQRG